MFFASISGRCRTDKLFAILGLVVLAVSFSACNGPKGNQCNATPFGTQLFDVSTGIFLPTQGPGYWAADANGRWGFIYEDSNYDVSVRVSGSGSWTGQVVAPKNSTFLNSTVGAGPYVLAALNGKFHVFFAGGVNGGSSTGIWDVAEQPNGTFGAPAQVGTGTYFISSVSSDDAFGKIALGVMDSSNNLYFAEMASSSVGTLAIQGTGLTGHIVGVGYAPDGTAWLAYEDAVIPAKNLYLARRTGSVWTSVANLHSDVPNGFYNALVKGPQGGIGDGKIIAVWENGAPGAVTSVSAMSYDLVASTASAPSAVLSNLTINVTNEITFDAEFTDSGDAIISYYDQGGLRAWLGHWGSTGFSNPVAFDASAQVASRPQIVLDNCGGTFVLFSSRDTSASPNVYTLKALQPADYGN